VVEELHELLLMWEEELTWREEALTAWEEKAGISEKALANVSTDLDVEWTKAKATRKEYLDKMAAHTTCAKHSLGLDKILGEKKVELDGREQDHELREAVLVEAQNRGLNPRDNRDELMELIELRKLLQDTKADRVIEASWLATLVRDVSKVLQDHGMPPIPEISRDPCTAGDVLEAVDVILEHLKEAYNFDHSPWE
jgi:hypothetical protein